jgi:hypothetical protein
MFRIRNASRWIFSIALIGGLSSPCAAQLRPKTANPTNPNPTNPSPTNPGTATTTPGTTNLSSARRPARTANNTSNIPIGITWNSTLFALSQANRDALVANAMQPYTNAMNAFVNPFDPFSNPWQLNPMNPFAQPPSVVWPPVFNNPWQISNPWQMNNPWQTYNPWQTNNPWQTYNPWQFNNPWQMNNSWPQGINPWNVQFGGQGLFSGNNFGFPPGGFGAGTF